MNTSANALKAVELVLDCDKNIGDINLDPKSKQFLTDLIDNWVFQNHVVGEKATIEEHEHVVLITKAYCFGWLQAKGLLRR